MTIWLPFVVAPMIFRAKLDSHARAKHGPNITTHIYSGTELIAQ